MQKNAQDIFLSTYATYETLLDIVLFWVL